MRHFTSKPPAMNNPSPCLLAIDTSTAFLSLGVHMHGQQHLIYEEAGTQQSALILPTIQRLLNECSITLSDIDAIVYAQGPGAFTGLRIGIGVAAGLAAPLNIPMMGIPCLAAVATLVPDEPCVLAATDARMHELFYAWFDTQTHTRLSDDCVGAADSIRLPENQSHGVGVGNAFGLGLSLPVTGLAQMPHADTYLKLALSGHYPTTPPAQAHLRYVRNKIALTAVEQAQHRGLHS